MSLNKQLNNEWRKLMTAAPYTSAPEAARKLLVIAASGSADERNQFYENARAVLDSTRDVEDCAASIQRNAILCVDALSDSVTKIQHELSSMRKALAKALVETERAQSKRDIVMAVLRKRTAHPEWFCREEYREPEPLTKKRKVNEGKAGAITSEDGSTMYPERFDKTDNQFEDLVMKHEKGFRDMMIKSLCQVPVQNGFRELASMAADLKSEFDTCVRENLLADDEVPKRTCIQAMVDCYVNGFKAEDVKKFQEANDEEEQIVTEACPECQPVPKEVFKDFQLPRVSNRFLHCFDHQLEGVLKWYATSPRKRPNSAGEPGDLGCAMCTWRDGVETVYAGNAADSLEAQGARDIWTSTPLTRNWLRQYTEPDGCGLPFYQQDTMKYIVSLMTPIDLYHLKRVSSAFNFYAEEEIAARASKPEVIFKASDVDNYTNEGIHPPCDRLYCEVRNFSKKLFCVVSNRTKCITFDMRESNGAYINHMHDHFCTVLLVLQDVAPELRHITVRGGFMSVRAILETVEWINTLELEDVYVYGFRHLIPGYVHSDMSYLECGWMRTEKSYLKLNALFARGANQPHHVIHVAEELLDTFHLTSKDPLPI
ncbi:uncharacterized protein LOC129597914 [Paramacrobiotus metropolitanus]|uniref:uncharacterized protein LOC129597914 n=1 Tax=Paramacrobiotus metropolitanus TaxID=2943436 RepID=UPI00244565F9|nr:uncharacterized protein LOC129597914 [Paramacrobiotus metropolitanus]